MKLEYLGHSSFKLINDNYIIYIDPYAGDDYDSPADLILVTHEHYDHNNVSLVKLKDNGKVYHSVDFIDGNKYKTYKLCGLTITAVPAYNKNHSIKECVGFIIEIGTKKIYFAGDTSTTDYMKKIGQMNIEYSFLPCDGIYNMNTQEATRCAELIGSRYAVPIHTKPGALFDENVAMSFTPYNKLILHPGEEIDV